MFDMLDMADVGKHGGRGQIGRAAQHTSFESINNHLPSKIISIVYARRLFADTAALCALGASIVLTMLTQMRVHLVACRAN